MSRPTSHHSVEHLKAITAATSDAIISVDSRGYILSWNPAAAKIFQYREDEALGRPVNIIIPQRFKAAHDRGIQRVNRGGARHVIGRTVELTGLRKDGSEVPIELSLSAWEISGARYYGGIIRDASERKRADAMILASERKFRSIADSANDAIISADADGRITSWNGAAQKIFGYTSAEAVQHPLTLIIPKRFRAAHERGLARVAQGGRRSVIGKTVELGGLHKDGREIPIELSLSTWESNGEKFFCGIIRDITERKEAESELRRSKEQLADNARKLRRANKQVRAQNEQLQALSNKLANICPGRSTTLFLKAGKTSGSSPTARCSRYSSRISRASRS